jgi:hypothetical protein
MQSGNSIDWAGLGGLGHRYEIPPLIAYAGLLQSCPKIARVVPHQDADKSSAPWRTTQTSLNTKKPRVVALWRS